MSARHRSSGFTLVELLVALALLALLSTLLLSGLRTGARAWNAVETVSDESTAILDTHRLLRERLAAAGQVANDGVGAGFAGGPETLGFRAPWLGGLPVAGAYRLEFGLLGDPGEFMVRWRAVEGGAALTGARVLLEGVDAVEWHYFGTTSADEPPAWRRDWPTEAARPPVLVALDIRFADPRRAWPLFRAAIP